MANPQNTPSDQDLNITDDNPNMGNVADDMDAGAPVPRPDLMGGTPMQPADEMGLGATEPIAYDEETDILIETPVEAEGAAAGASQGQQAQNPGMAGDAMNYAGGTAPGDTESAYTATPDTREGMPQGSSPSNTGLEGAGSREPGGEGFDTANSGLAGTENTPSNAGLEGQGVTEDGETTPRNA